ncbi:MAG: cation-translocating P-type ATPase C-terminal domain-containing protein, partial [Eubacteriales bacterium]|nr:cation-translocating P-type ATPase C-terminal domain-containing protein [Eubacteriales bacterium]
LYATLAALPNPFAPVHLLFINLVTDSLPAIAIGLEPHHNDMMNERPRLKTVSILNRSFAVDVLAEGFLIAVATLTAFYLGLASGQAGVASTMAFATLCLARLLHGFSSRSRESLFKIGIFTNLYLWAAMIIGYLLLMGVLHFRPLMDLFEVVPLTAGQYGLIYGLSIAPLVLVQAYKLLWMKRQPSH